MNAEWIRMAKPENLQTIGKVGFTNGTILGFPCSTLDTCADWVA